MSLDITSKEFWVESELEGESKRVFDICNGCRRCYNLCPSFNDLFERLDNESVDGDAEKLGPADLRSVTDLCYQCKLCFNHCPYTPPHRWDLDFPRLMMRSKAVQVRRDGQSIQDRFLGHVDRMGRLGSAFPRLTNWALRNRINRWLMEKLLGIHRHRVLPEYAPQTFRQWVDKRQARAADADRNRVALFYTCTVNFHEPETGTAAVKVLEKNGIQVICPEQRCCGMPFLDGGDIEAAKKNAQANLDSLYPYVEKGFDVVVPGPTCSYVLKREYPVLLGGETAQKLAAKTFDICEYLMRLYTEGKLDTGFIRGAGRVAYQIPCHLRAQNIGYKSRDLMQLIPGTSVQLIERCSAIDGTWGLKRQYYDLSVKVAEPLLRDLREGQADVTATDCPLSGLQIEQGLGKKPVHPIRLLAQAYGLEEK
ncbi:MAG: anaerobic glycerol-3-phosphate dehydrogenase subunit C [Deltaproteobacteria bacterium]|nr:anaerobic glycerol-3-phosphate dehydrogenase subunit C [Deltaproteobacteria bacterium]